MRHAGSIFALCALINHANAFWRMVAKGSTGVARIDPIVSPGEISNHAHIVFGGSNFGPSANYASLKSSTCTSNAVTQDNSAYWTPALYFRFTNGTYQMVNNVGGMLAYYLLYLDDLVAFPEGFQMVAGNPSYRNFTGPFPDTDLSSWSEDPANLNQYFLQQRALGFNCLNYQATPEGSLYRHQFPAKSYMDQHCTDGLRLELAFPSCGTGALSSPDQSHVAYPSLVKEGVCPDGYDVHYPFLFYETIWDTYAFANYDGEFVLSTGDPGSENVQSGGSSYHGDFMMGWDSADFLQQAINTCTNASGQIQDCPLFNIQSEADQTSCKFNMPADLANENTQGPRSDLPVDVPIQTGPQPATKYLVVGQNSNAATSAAASTTSTPAPAYTSTTSPSTTFVTSTSSSAPAAPYVPQHQVAPEVPEVSAGGGQPLVVNNVANAPTTSSASLPSSTLDSNTPVATSWATDGAQVIEWLIDEVVVTVTASSSPTPPSRLRRRHEHHRRPQHRH